jgi:asparagine synthase (glutamine-hydrolysing)
MCGVCGIIGSGGHEDWAESRVRWMMNNLVHRGPDEEGILKKPGAMLGMRRLSIIDLEGGRQPVYNENGDVGVVFNGEIYNFPQLRGELEARHRFRTRSDTEVVVHAYEEWGARFLEHLQGMFAFALWDGRAIDTKPDSTGNVLLARDRLGIKPLYYAFADGKLFFASEVRALLAGEAVARRLSAEAVEAYLLFGSVVEPMTLVKGIFSLPPGHSFTVACGTPLLPHPTPYWDVAALKHNAARDRNAPHDMASAARATRPLLEDAVRSHLLADVPLGLFLSSGIDSTAIAALAARERSGLRTFTVIFPEEEFSEARLARETASRLGCEHCEFVLSAEQMQARLLDSIGALDQASMDGVNTFFVSWAARQVGLKVALSGLGGDEVFGGYPTFRATPRVARIAALVRLMPGPVRNAVSTILLETSDSGLLPLHSDATRKLAAIWSNPHALPHPYFYARMLFTPQQTEQLLLPSAFSPGCSGDRDGSVVSWRSWIEQVSAQSDGLDGGSAVSWLELRTYMVDTLLRDTDAMSMHHSLEVRVPLLDHPLVEFVAGLPDSVKVRSGVSKALLAEALGDLLPREIVRQPKRTFTFPWQRWLHGPLGQEVGSRLSGLSPSLAGVLDAKTVQSIWASFLAGRTGWARPWSLFVLNEWVRRHVDAAEPIAEPARTPADAIAS